MIGICLDCFIEKGLTVTTTADLCNANNLQNGGSDSCFETKEEMLPAFNHGMSRSSKRRKENDAACRKKK